MLRVGASARRSLIEKAAEAAAQSLHRQAALRLHTVSMRADVVEEVGRGVDEGGGAPGRFSLLEGCATVKSGRGGHEVTRCSSVSLLVARPRARKQVEGERQQLG